jgi:hypothetical protein
MSLIGMVFGENIATAPLAARILSRERRLQSAEHSSGRVLPDESGVPAPPRPVTHLCSN